MDRRSLLDRPWTHTDDSTLPGRAGQGGGDRVPQPGMGVRGHHPDAGQAAGDQAAQKSQPPGAVLGGDDVDAERLGLSGWNAARVRVSASVGMRRLWYDRRAA